MAEQVLYRKYRSADFGDVIGQSHVVQTLTNAVTTGRVAHAYLFTGPRGTGKTSVARLLAKAINCTGDSKPCNSCENCSAHINSSLDVIEMDAASNRRIEEIRDLRDKINLAPTMGRYKVYIIDEVHMLTTEAFNALLKTLEEPPAHAVLILATTEAHKLPETIISRTQRFSFNPISTNDIVGRLQHIAKLEGIKIETNALELIASAARGGFRDAISLLDQVAASGVRPVTADLVRQNLGWSDPAQRNQILEALAAGDIKQVLAVLAEMFAAGAQAGQLSQDLVRDLRAIMLAQASSGSLGASSGYLALAQAWSLQRFASSIDALVAVGRSSWPEVSLEAALVNLVCLDEPATHATARVVEAKPQASKLPKPKPVDAPVSDAPSPAETTPSQPAPAKAVARDLWPKALLIIKERHNNLFSVISSCEFKLDGSQGTLTSKHSFHRNRINEPQYRQIIEQALTKVYGQPITIKAVMKAAPAAATRSINPSSELVSSALEILGGEVVDGEN